MTEEKGLDGAVADKIGEFVNLKGGQELLSKLEADPTLSANADAKKGLDDMAKLFTYLKIFGVLDKVSLDMSLARGLGMCLVSSTDL
jgi:histidyl-tRNA synthetase